MVYGEIIDQFDGVLMLQLQSASDPAYNGNIIATHIDLVTEMFEGEYFAEWTFFKTQEKLDEYLALMGSYEPKSSVVAPVKK